MFIRCIETGFQDDNIASKMRSVLKDKNIADEDLIQKLNEVVDAENERQTNCSQLVRQGHQCSNYNTCYAL